MAAADDYLEELTCEECYLLLLTAGGGANEPKVGRLGVNAEDYPLIFPVNYAIDDRARVIVFRTALGTKFLAANRENVTFEVDEVNYGTRSGWSVLVRGVAEEVTGSCDSELVERTRATAVEPWAGGRREHWMRLTPKNITGRRIRPHTGVG